MKYILTIEADVSEEEIIGLKEELAERIEDIRVVDVRGVEE